MSRDGDRSGLPSRSVSRLLVRDVTTLSLLTVSATAPVAGAIGAFASAPLWGGDPWLAAAVVFVGASLLLSPLIVPKLRWLSRMAADGVLVVATLEGWADVRPPLLKLTQTPGYRLPRYSYVYLGTVHHVLLNMYFFTREQPNRLRVLVDPERPERVAVLGMFTADPLPPSRIPPISSSIGPWLGRLDQGVAGCGCSLLIFLLGLGLTGYGFGHPTLPPGPVLDAWVFIGLASPVVGLLYLLWRLVTRRR